MQKKLSVEHKPWRGEESIREAIAREIETAPSKWRRSLRAFEVWLRDDRGLALSSIRGRIASIRRFVVALKGKGGVQTLKTVAVTDVEDFFIEYGKGHGHALTRNMQAAMRLFLRFAASKGWVKRGLADAVPSIRKYRLSHVPRGIPEETVHAIVAMSAQKSARDYAIVLLLTIYGVRRGQISALRLDDIDWRKKTIAFRPQKGGKIVQHELVPTVAAALAEYLLNERPKVDNPAVFLRTLKPYLALGPPAVTDAICSLTRQLGSECSFPRGPHAFRHAFATRLLRSGQPLKVISDLLGHRSLDAASIYTKVDHPRLLEVAAEWPEVVS